MTTSNRFLIAAALAKLRNAEVVTGDPEFKEVEGEVKVAGRRGRIELKNGRSCCYE